MVLSSRPPTSLPTLLRADVTVAAVVGMATLIGGLIQGASVLEAVAGAALALPLAWRSRGPLRALGVVAAAGVLYIAAVDALPAYVVPAGLALYTVAVSGERRRTLYVGAALVPCVVAVVVGFSPEDGSTLGQTLELVSQLALPLAVGEAVRTQRALIASLRERAEQSEHERELETRRQVVEERMRIARELHDVVAHSLATIATQASVGVHLGERDPSQALETLGDVKRVSTEALHELRHALGTLRDDEGEAPTRPPPSLQALPELVDQARRSGLSVALRMQGSPTALPAALQLAIYRMVQEGLTNVMRHAGGARATVRVAVGGGQVEVDVTDDGSGQPTALGATGSGAGLIGMRERARALGGAFESGAAVGGGFHIRAVLPVDERPE